MSGEGLKLLLMTCLCTYVKESGDAKIFSYASISDVIIALILLDGILKRPFAHGPGQKLL